MRLPEQLVLLFALSISASTGASQALETRTDPDIIGEAVDIDSGELLYQELHYCQNDGRQCTVLYKDDSGRLIARKQLDYRDSLQAPALQVEDMIKGSEFTSRNEDYGDGYVVDAGFDNFIRLQWGNFETGDSVRFPLLLAGRNKPLSMRAENRKAEDCPDAQMCLRVRLDSWLLSKLVTPIDLTYERDSQRLLRYRGISNISLAGGKNPSVDISYRYSHQSGNKPMKDGSE